MPTESKILFGCFVLCGSLQNPKPLFKPIFTAGDENGSQAGSDATTVPGDEKEAKAMAVAGYADQRRKDQQLTPPSCSTPKTLHSFDSQTTLEMGSDAPTPKSLFQTPTTAEKQSATTAHAGIKKQPNKTKAKHVKRGKGKAKVGKTKQSKGNESKDPVRPAVPEPKPEPAEAVVEPPKPPAVEKTIPPEPAPTPVPGTKPAPPGQLAPVVKSEKPEPPVKWGPIDPNRSASEGDILGLLSRGTTLDQFPGEKLPEVARPPPQDSSPESLAGGISSTAKPRKPRDLVAHARRMRFYRSLDSLAPKNLHWLLKFYKLQWGMLI